MMFAEQRALFLRGAMRDEAQLNLVKKRRPKEKDGGIAQLGEHLLCKQGVIGSIPIISTKRR